MLLARFLFTDELHGLISITNNSLVSAIYQSLFRRVSPILVLFQEQVVLIMFERRVFIVRMHIILYSFALSQPWAECSYEYSIKYNNVAVNLQ